MITFILFVLVEAACLGVALYLGWTACERVLGRAVNEVVQKRVKEKLAARGIQDDGGGQ